MINVGIIGAGRIGQVHARSILAGVPEARILAIADPFMKPEVAEWAKNAGIEGVYTEYKKILEDERIDAVLICASTLFLKQHSACDVLGALLLCPFVSFLCYRKER